MPPPYASGNEVTWPMIRETIPNVHIAVVLIQNG